MQLNDQFRVMDSIKFNSHSMFNGKEDNGKNSNILVIGENRVQRPLIIENGLFIDPQLTRKTGNDLNIGFALAGSILKMNVNIHGSISDDIKQLIGSYSPNLFVDLTEKRHELDLETIKGSNAIWLDLTGPESINDLSGDPSDKIPPEITDHKDLIHFIGMLKEIVDVPVIVSIRGLDVKNDLDRILVSKADAVNISMGYSIDDREIDIEPVSDPVTSVIEAVKHFNVFRSFEKGVKLLVSGPIRNSMDIVKLKCLGVDGICPGLSILSSIGICSSKKKLDWAESGECIEKNIRDLVSGKDSIMKILNIRFEGELDRSLLMVDDYHSGALTGLPLAGYGQVIPFWKH